MLGTVRSWSKRVGTVAGVSVGGAVVASVAWATVPDAGGVIHGCRNTSSGALRVIDTGAGQSCNSSTEKGLNWSSQILKFRGAWSSSTAYSPNDVVTAGGSSYLAKIASTNKPPASNPSVWGLLAAKGAPGPAGMTHSYAEPNASTFTDLSNSIRTVVSTTVPAGSFLVTFTATSTDYSSTSPNDFRCDLYTPSTYVTSAYGNNWSGNPQSGVSTQALINTSGGTLHVECVDSNSAVRILNPSLVATQVNAVSGAVTN